MSTFDPRPSRSFTTAAGVLVTVVEQPEPEPRSEPEPEPIGPRVIIVPESALADERDDTMRWLCEQHGAYIERLLARRRDVLAESAKDLHQRVLLIACDRVDKAAPPGQVRTFLAAIVNNEVRNHQRRWRPDVDPGADIGEAITSAPSPETGARQAEEREKLTRYIAALPKEEAQVIEYVDRQGLTLEEAAVILGRPLGTVATQRTRAWKRLREMALASQRGTTMGAEAPPSSR